MELQQTLSLELSSQYDDSDYDINSLYKYSFGNIIVLEFIEKGVKRIRLVSTVSPIRVWENMYKKEGGEVKCIIEIKTSRKYFSYNRAAMNHMMRRLKYNVFGRSYMSSYIFNFCFDASIKRAILGFLDKESRAFLVSNVLCGSLEKVGDTYKVVEKATKREYGDITDLEEEMERVSNSFLHKWSK